MVTKDARMVEIQRAINKSKSEILNEFEKVCPTETSFSRVRKDIHDIFDALLAGIEFHI